MRLSETKLAFTPDSSTYLGAVRLGTLSAAPPPPPPELLLTTPGASASVRSASAAESATVVSTTRGTRKVGVMQAGRGGIPVKKRKPGSKKQPTTKPSSGAGGRAPGTTYSPNEMGADSDVTITSTTEPAPSAGTDWMRYAKWGGMAALAGGAIFAAWKGVKMLRARRGSRGAEISVYESPRAI